MRVKISGFTLSETLLTLGVIGVIAAIVIPNLNKSINEQEYKTSYKKAFSIANQAVENGKREYSFSSSSYDDDNQVYLKNFLAFKEQFSVVKECVSNNNSDCWDVNGEHYYSSLYPNQEAYAFIDKSGVAWSMCHSTADRILVDTNGFKKPNQWGKDRFAFYIQFPAGGSAALHSASAFPDKVRPLADNISTLCFSPNKCATQSNYHGTGWLYQ